MSSKGCRKWTDGRTREIKSRPSEKNWPSNTTTWPIISKTIPCHFIGIPSPCPRKPRPYSLSQAWPDWLFFWIDHYAREILPATDPSLERFYKTHIRIFDQFVQTISYKRLTPFQQKSVALSATFLPPGKMNRIFVCMFGVPLGSLLGALWGFIWAWLAIPIVSILK